MISQSMGCLLAFVAGVWTLAIGLAMMFGVPGAFIASGIGLMGFGAVAEITRVLGKQP